MCLLVMFIRSLCTEVHGLLILFFANILYICYFIVSVIASTAKQPHEMNSHYNIKYHNQPADRQNIDHLSLFKKGARVVNKTG
jgi:hypothetical protein